MHQNREVIQSHCMFNSNINPLLFNNEVMAQTWQGDNKTQVSVVTQENEKTNTEVSDGKN